MSCRALTKLGYVLDRDYVLSQGKDGIVVEWLRRDVDGPTKAEIDAAEMAAAIEDDQAAQGKTTLDNLRTQVRGALTALNTIQGAASFTNAQRDAAIKELAQILERVIRVMMDIAR